MKKEIEEAYSRIRRDLARTPLELSYDLSMNSGAKVFLKHEDMQYTGSFKLRGALSKISSLSKSDLAKGVVTASTGNHGMAVSYAASKYGSQATVFLPATTDPLKKKRILALGSSIEEVKGDCLVAELAARELARVSRRVFISPYNDPEVIAGQGTVGLEMHEQIQENLAKLDAVFVTVGGGGLISGIAGFLKAINPKIKIYGCWSRNARTLHECLRLGKIIPFTEKPTYSSSSAGGVEDGAITFEYCQQWIDEKVLVSEKEIQTAVRRIVKNEHCMIEGSAGVAVAAFVKSAAALKGKTVGIVLCGRNLPLDEFVGMIK